jgi:hypothetical protein
MAVLLIKELLGTVDNNPTLTPSQRSAFEV